MKTRLKFGSLATGSIVVFFVLLHLSGLILWVNLSLEEKENLVRLVQTHYLFFTMVLFLLLVGFVILVNGIFIFYILPVRKMAEETNLLLSANPTHRLEINGGVGIRRLAQIINDLGDRLKTLQNRVDEEIAVSRAELEKEKNILAAFIAELSEGVLICNAEGQILFYNRMARELFEQNPEPDFRPASGRPEAGKPALVQPGQKYVGLGRSIFSLIDKDLVAHALDEIAGRIRNKNGGAASCFVVATQGGRLLRIEAVPILNDAAKLNGFVLLATDISAQLEKDSRLNTTLNRLVKGIRDSVGGIRSAIETIIAYPQMDEAQLDRFRLIVLEESIKLGELVDRSAGPQAGDTSSRWPLVPMPAGDLIVTALQKTGEKHGLTIHVEEGGKDHWIQVDTYCMILIIRFLMDRLQAETNCRVFSAKVHKQDRFVNLDIFWEGRPMLLKTLREWQAQELRIDGDGLALTLNEVIGYHGAGIWVFSAKDHQNLPCLRVFFPVSQPPEPSHWRNITILTDKSRPVFYDFDLFSRQEVRADLDHRALADLEFTVFDTETTGINPRQGDEIISIGAVRVVNGHLLHEEFFDQLVDPRRGLTHESIRIHGIQPEMLEGQPVIGQVLPLFQRFCENTVLVAHNAAFDMLLLKLKEEATGVKFTNPVLDTLHLSEVLHPAQQNHQLQAIAQLLGVRILGRHTALGDALATAEIMVKMIPLLAQKGIFTLEDARLASQRTYHARMKY